MLLLALFACSHDDTVGGYTVSVEDDGGLALVRSDGKVLLEDLRFASGQGTSDIEMQAGSYLVEADAEYTALEPGRGRGEDPSVIFPLRDPNGDEVGTLQVREDAEGVVSFGVVGAGNRVRWDAACTGDDHFAGLGQHAMDVDHVGEAFALWVSEPGVGKTDDEDQGDDWFLTGTKHASSYPDPFLVRPDPLGVMIDTPSRIDVDLCTGDRWRLDAWEAEVQFLVLDGETPLDIVKSHAMITGPAPTPPLWATGPWNDAVGGAERVREVAATLRAAGAPSSVIWTEDWKGAAYEAWGYHLLPSWSVDETLYPEPKTIDAELEAMGFKWLAYFSPFLVADTVEAEEAAAYTIRDADSETYWFVGVTLDDTTVLDLSRDDARRWAREKMQAAAEIGFDGWMADYGEWLPADARIAAGDALELHNAYPGWWQQANRDALAEIPNGDLDLLYFTRSGWAGTVGLTPTAWAGDQRTSFDADDGYPTVVPMSIGAGVSGIAWYGSDIAGYQSLDNPPSTKELWFRWCTLGAFSPLMRTHHGAYKDDNWQFDSDEETLAHYARYATVHTELYPYLRGLGAQASTDGTPIVLAPFLLFPDEPWGRTDAWMLGPSLFVAPVLTEGATSRDVSLPAGPTWYDFWTGAVATSGVVDAPVDAIPVFAPAGAVIPMFTEAPESLVSGPLTGVRTLYEADQARTIRVYAGAAGTFRESDGTTYTTDGVATGSGTATATLNEGTISAGGLTLTVSSGHRERVYTLEVVAPG